MSSKIIILLLLIIGQGTINANSQTIINSERLLLYTDRDYCISGDTIWFKVWVPKTLEQSGNVVRVQLDTKGNNLISGVAQKSKNGWAEGFIFVPDSLSTGLCFVTAFLNSQRNNSDIEVESNSLFVYNRFEERVSELEVSELILPLKKANFGSQIEINSNKTEYSTREKVTVKIGLDPEIEFKSAIVKATLIDPLAAEIGGKYKFRLKSSNLNIPNLVEEDGVLLSGKVLDSEGNAQNGVLIILSIVSEPPYFDYYISGKEGDFNFFLKNAVGSTNVILQAISESGKEYFIRKELNYLVREENIPLQRKVLTPIQSDFISSVINGSFVNKLFNPPITKQSEFFEMPARFLMPFYGPPTKRVVPDDFIDLPDFQEISRELLNGVQYRTRDGEVTFRMLNDGMGMFFNNEPLRLLNGVPVFKNNLFTSLKSTDISYIDIVQNERVFGDLSFKGILAVSLNDKSNGWMVQQPSIFQINVKCLQPEKNPGYLMQHETETNQPDIRQIYLWEILQVDSDKPFDFLLSDLKGKVEISVEGITNKNKVFKASKIIEVK